MIKFSRRSALLLAGSASIAVASGAIASYTSEYEPHNVKASGTQTGVRTAEVADNNGVIPTIQVFHNGEKYDAIPKNAKLNFQLAAKASCRPFNLFTVTNVFNDLKVYVNDDRSKSPHGHPSHHAPVWSNHPISSLSAKLAYNSSHTLGGNVPAGTKAAAIKACNAFVDDEMKKGKSRAQALATPRLINWTEHAPSLSGVVAAKCTNGGGHAHTGLRVKYQCNGSASVKLNPALGGGGAGGLAVTAPIGVESVTASVSPDKYQGKCPAKLFAEGLVTTAGPNQKVWYRWSLNGSSGKIYSATSTAMRQVNAGYSFQVSNTKAVQQPGLVGGQQGQSGMNFVSPDANIINGNVQLLVLHEKSAGWATAARSKKVTYRVDCSETKPPRAKTPRATPGSKDAKPARRILMPDLLSKDGLTIGSKTAAWGSALTIHGSDASERRGNRCGFRMRYLAVNHGSKASGPFSSRLRADGTSLHSKSGIHLAAGKHVPVAGMIHLSDGIYDVTAMLDDAETVAELNESNNFYRIRLTVKGCVAPRPRQTR